MEKASKHRELTRRNPIEQQYRLDLSVGREGTVKYVRDKINALGSGQPTKPIVEIFGIPGIGKTWLLQHFIHRLSPSETSSDEAALKQPLVAQFDFAELTQKPLYFHYFALLKILASQLLQQSGSSFKIPYLDSDRAPTPKQLDKMAKGFVSFIQLLGDSFVPVLAFDTTDLAEELVIRWLDEAIIFPLAQNNQALFVFAGRERLFWPLFGVRRRVDAISLSSFDKWASVGQLMKLDISEEEAKQIDNVTHGHPYANQILTQHPSIHTDLTKAVADLRDTYLDQMLQPLKRWRRQEGKIKITMPFDDPVDLLWNMVGLRQFHTDQLRRIWAKTRDDTSFIKKAEGDYLDFISSLIDIGIVSWNGERGGYAFDSSFHDLMKGVLKTLDPDALIKQHQAAIEIYTDYCYQYPEHGGKYLAERLYHSFELLRMTQSYMNEQVEEVINTSLDLIRNAPNPQFALENFIEAIKQDPDLKNLPLWDKWANERIQRLKNELLTQ